MSIIKRLESAATNGPIPCPVAAEAVMLLSEINDFLEIVAYECSIDMDNARYAINAIRLIRKIGDE